MPVTAPQLVVLGSAGSHPGPGRMCSSYLLEADGYRLVLDLGNGALGNLLRHCDASEIDALVLSHRHPDHWADTIGFYYARRFDPAGPRPVPVYGLAELPSFIAQLLPGDEEFPKVCRFEAVAPGDALDLGPFHVRLHAAHHVVPTLAARVEVDGRALTYTADTAPSDDIVAAGRDADVFVADCTWLGRAGPWPEGVHMSGEEAGRQAQAAGAKRLVVTHVSPFFDPADVAEEARTTYDGEVLVANDLDVVPW